VGIPDEEYLAVTVDFAPGIREGTLEERRALVQQQLVERLEAEPRVQSVAVASVLPRMEHPDQEIEVGGGPGAGDALRRLVHTIQADPGFFESLDQPILRGRGFERADVGTGGSAVIVNTALVEQTLGGRDPLGSRIRFVSETDTEDSPWYDIVGVVGPLGVNILAPGGGEAVYLPTAPGDIRPLRLGIHVGASPEDFTPRLREIVREVDPLATIDEPREPRAVSRWGSRGYAGFNVPGPVMIVTALVPGLCVLVLVTLLACAGPTLRALRIDPNEVLKAEG